MRLHSPAFERRLRRGVKRAVSRSRELKREYREAKKVRKQHRAEPLFRVALSIGVTLVTWYIIEARGVGAAIAGLSLYALGFTLVHAQGLRTTLYQSADLPALLELPISERGIFLWQLQKFLRRSLMSLLDFLGGYSVIALWVQPPGWSLVLILPTAVFTWAVTVALAMLLFVRFPRVPYNLATMALTFFVIFVFVARDSVGATMLAWLGRHGGTLNLGLPTGWAGSIFQFFIADGHWTSLTLLLPMALVIWTAKKAVASLIAGYTFYEPERPQSPDLIPGAEPGPAEDGDDEMGQAQKPVRLGLTSIEEIVLTGHFLTAFRWNERGWLEGRLWSWLNERERALSEFVLPTGLRLSQAWKNIGRNLSVGLFLTLFLGWIIPWLKPWIAGLTILVTAVQVLSQVLNSGSAFHLIGVSGVNIPVYALFGIGYRELARLLFKLSLVQFPLVLLFTVVCGNMVAWFVAVPGLTGLLTGLKAGVLLYAGKFLAVTLAFSNGTNDTSQRFFRTTFLVVPMLTGVGLFLGCGAVSVINSDLTGWVGLVLAVLSAYATFRLYGWFYHGNRFDLMAVPRR